MASKNFCDLCDEEIKGEHNPYFHIDISQRKQNTYEEISWTVDPEKRLRKILLEVDSNMVCKNCTEQVRLLIHQLTKKT
jgi:hypothetical protein